MPPTRIFQGTELMHLFRRFARVSTRVSRITLAAFTVVAVSLALAVSLISLRFARMQQTLTPMVQRELAQLLGRDVRIGAVRLAAWNQVAIDNTAVAGGTTFADGATFSAPEITARLDLSAWCFTAMPIPSASSIN